MTPPEAPGALATPAPHPSDAQAPASAPRLATRRRAASPSLLGTRTNDPRTATGSTLTLFPSRPKRVTDALHALAETPGLTEREYLRRKHEILNSPT